MASRNSTLLIDDLSGGINDTDSPVLVPDDQCLEAENIEFVRSPLGERRLGCEQVTLTSSGLTSHDFIPLLHRHLPSADETEAQLWATGFTSNSSVSIAYKDSSWHAVTPIDEYVYSSTHGFHHQAISFHGKLFYAGRSATDRLHVWDGTSFRRTGLRASTAPTVTDSVPGGTFAGTRYYRYRNVEFTDGVTVRRSEPSEVTTFVPAGTQDSASITIPTDTEALAEGSLHLEIEASIDNVNFYMIERITRVVSTHIDTTPYTTGYADFELSEDIGDYELQTSCKFLAIDEDRLLMAGSWTTADYASRVWWTPVNGDPGVGNNERIPTDTDNFLDLDGGLGGEIVGISNSINGAIYVFKRAYIYKMIRTGNRTRAYEAFPVSSNQFGALRGSLVYGVDQSGDPCLYFLDPAIGPCRIGKNGVEMCGRDISVLWSTVEPSATIPCTGFFWPAQRQVHWCIATTGNGSPDTRIVLQTDRCVTTVDTGVRKGWSTATGIGAHGISSCLYSSNIGDNTTRDLILLPLVGLGPGDAFQIVQLGVGNLDVADFIDSHVLTKPYLIAGLLNRFGVMAAAVLAKAQSNITLVLSLIRDFGVETPVSTSITCTPVGSETFVIKPVDNLSASELTAVQFKYTNTPVLEADPYEVHQVALKLSARETA